jgi:tetratricopeptide (TPR) repeat protein
MELAKRIAEPPNKPEENTEKERLINELGKADGFTLFFAICKSEPYIKKLVSDLKNFKPTVEVIELNENDHLLEVLQKATSNSPKDSVFVIVGLDLLIDSEQKKQDEILELLEEQQDEFIDFNRPLLFLISPPVLQILKDSAAEFWTWNKGVFNIESISTEFQPKFYFISDLFANVFRFGPYKKKIHFLRHYKTMLEGYQKSSSRNTVKLQIKILGKIALLHFELGDYHQAKDYFLKQLDLLSIEVNHLLAICTLNNIGKVYECLGSYEYALGYFNKALNRNEDTLKKKPYYRALLLNNIGWAYYLLGKKEDALSYCNEALEIGEKKLGLDDPRLIPVLYKVGNLHHFNKDEEEALEFFRRILQLTEKEMGVEHPYIASVMHSIGMVYKNQNNFADALNYLCRWMEDTEESLGPKHPLVALQINDIGKVYVELKEYDKALKYFRWALSVRKEFMGTDDPFVGKIYANIGMTYLKKNEYDMARIELERALTILEMKLPEDHPAISEILEVLNQISQNQNQNVN